MSDMNFGTKGVETRIDDRTGRFIGEPTVGIFKVAGVIHSISADKETPGMELILEGAPEEDFEPYEGKFPISATLKKEGYEKQVEINGPIATTVWWISPKTMGKEDSWSTYQKVLQVAEALQAREALDSATEGINNPKEYAEAVGKAFTGKKGAFIIQLTKNTYVKDGTLKTSNRCELPSFGNFALPVDQLDVLRKKFEQGKYEVEEVSDEAKLLINRNGTSSAPREEVEF